MVADVSDEVGVLPLRTTHDVVIVVAAHVRLDADPPLNFGIDIRVVRDVANVKNAQGSTVLALEIDQPFIHLRSARSRCSSLNVFDDDRELVVDGPKH